MSVSTNSLTPGSLIFVAMQHISSKPTLKAIGVSDFSSYHLKRLLSQLPPELATTRRPTIDQLNFDRELPEALVELAKQEGITLQSHSDNRGESRKEGLTGMLTPPHSSVSRDRDAVE